MTNSDAVRLVSRKPVGLLNTESCCLSVLDKLAQEIQFDTWKDIKDTVNPTFRTTEIERAVELGFVAGQKQKEKEVESVINEVLLELDFCKNVSLLSARETLLEVKIRLGLSERLFSEGGEKKV